jgi:hypothetical protein
MISCLERRPPPLEQRLFILSHICAIVRLTSWSCSVAGLASLGERPEAPGLALPLTKGETLSAKLTSLLGLLEPRLRALLPGGRHAPCMTLMGASC